MTDNKLDLKHSQSILFGIFENPDAVLETTKKVYSKGLNIIDVYSPFPIHGIEKAMGLKRTLLPVGAFICGLTGFLTALSLQSFVMYFDWPIIIGNKPFAGIPAWIPVLFELSVLFTAFGIGILFFVRNGMIHGKVSKNIVDLRQTDDRMVLAINIDDVSINKNELIDMLAKGGAVEIKERNNVNEDEYVETVIDLKNIKVSASHEEGHNNANAAHS